MNENSRWLTEVEESVTIAEVGHYSRERRKLHITEDVVFMLFGAALIAALLALPLETSSFIGNIKFFDLQSYGESTMWFAGVGAGVVIAAILGLFVLAVLAEKSQRMKRISSVIGPVVISRKGAEILHSSGNQFINAMLAFALTVIISYYLGWATPLAAAISGNFTILGYVFVGAFLIVRSLRSLRRLLPESLLQKLPKILRT